MTIILESKIYEVERIYNKTTANGFRDLKENDRIKITYNGDKDEMYMDAYKKWENKRITKLEYDLHDRGRS